MSRRWQVTDTELIAVWDKLFKDRLPAPLFALHRGENAQEWAVLAEQAVARLAEGEDGGLYDALTRVAHADIRVTTMAFDPRRPDEPGGRVRLVGARQGAVATLICQLPGETRWHSGGYIITTGEADRLAGAVVGALPTREPGRLPDTSLVTLAASADIDHHYGRSPVYDSYAEVDRASASWLRQPVERLGLIEICLGSSIFGPRGISRHRIEWRDLVDDGRYALRVNTAGPVAVAVDRTALAALLAAGIAAVRQTLEDENRV
ncbi:ESX secretion-associated protein EspG [Nocardia salmonicida]|uniref:ESX secretion-associated protein EspG n=1 Tax=Nocardia salmonicida TaxID=53431 RepID=UPI00368F472B